MHSEGENMNKHKLWILLAALCGVSGCAVWQQAQAPVVPANGMDVDGVTLVEVQPAAACVFKGAVMGDTNPDVSGIPESLLHLNNTIRQGLVSSAKQMGGNTVWVRTQSWQNPDMDTDYFQPFYINNVRYGALVYQCPN